MTLKRKYNTRSKNTSNNETQPTEPEPVDNEDRVYEVTKKANKNKYIKKIKSPIISEGDVITVNCCHYSL